MRVDYKSLSRGGKRTFDLICGYPPRLAFSRLLLMLRAYIDDSLEAGKVLIFSGYVAEADEWMRFSQDWDGLLSINPKIDAFKMSSMNARGEAGMERAMFHYKCVSRYNLMGFGCAVLVDDLQKVVNEMGIPHKYANPYLMAWRLVLTAYMEMAKEKSLSERVDIIFDSTSNYPQIVSAWKDYVNSAPVEITTLFPNPPIIMSDNDLPPLQAADLVSWWVRLKFLSDRTSVLRAFPREWTGDKLTLEKFIYITEDGIRKVFEEEIRAAGHIAPTN